MSGLTVHTITTLALRCPECGKLSFHEISRFAFSRAGKIKAYCPCGRHVVTVGRKQCGQLWLQIPCLLCETTHFLFYSSREFWSPLLHNLYCTETGLEIGFFGSEREVKDTACTSEIENHSTFWENGEEEDYFTDPDIMYQVLNHLHDVAEKGRLSCPCGNRNLKVDIYPNRLELRCPACSRSMVILAEKEEDLAAMKEMKTIEMTDRLSTYRKKP